MNKSQKFIGFLESLKNGTNDALIESVKNGYSVISVNEGIGSSIKSLMGKPISMGDTSSWKKFVKSVGPNVIEDIKKNWNDLGITSNLQSEYRNTEETPNILSLNAFLRMPVNEGKAVINMINYVLKKYKAYKQIEDNDTKDTNQRELEYQRRQELGNAKVNERESKYRSKEPRIEYTTIEHLPKGAVKRGDDREDTTPGSYDSEHGFQNSDSVQSKSQDYVVHSEPDVIYRVSTYTK